MTTTRWLGAAITALSVALFASPALAGSGSDDQDQAKGVEKDEQSKEPSKDIHKEKASPFIVGSWKFVPNGTGTPNVDTEFRFINPTPLTATLEYAFFELDGTFCGCDRDQFQPNKTTIYTMLAESLLPPPLSNGPAVFSCKGTSGALKSIVFFNKGQEIFLGQASQVGFQTHAFGNLVETDTSLQGSVMTEATMAPVPLDDATRDEIRHIHNQCVTVNGPLGG